MLLSLCSQSLDVFGAALESGQLGPLMMQFGLQAQTAQAAATGSEGTWQTDTQTDVQACPDAAVMLQSVQVCSPLPEHCKVRCQVRRLPRVEQR